MKTPHRPRFQFGRSLLAVCCMITLWPRIADAQQAQWQEGVHYTLSKAAVDPKPFDTKITVTVLVSYAYAESAPLIAGFQKWQASLPKSVRATLVAHAEDQRTLVLARLFHALNILKRPDLHLRAYLENLIPGKALVVEDSTKRVDFEKSQQVQERFLASHGVAPEEFRRVMSDPAINSSIATTTQFLDKHGSPAAIPGVYVNGKYISDLRRVGAVQNSDARAATGRLFDVMNHLIALADIDIMKAHAANNKLLVNLQNDPVLGAWHTIVPNIFEVERKSGTWYYHREEGFGGRAILTDLDTGKVLTGTGAARVTGSQVLAAMQARNVWADHAAVALRAGATMEEVERQEMPQIWTVRRSVNRREVLYFLSADGRYHFVTVAQAKEIADSQASIDSLLQKPADSGARRLTEGAKGTPSSLEDKTSRARELAKIADADTVVYAPAGTPRATLTTFLDPTCHGCRRLHHEAGKFTALGIKLRFVPVHREALSTNIWCAKDRRAALANAMKEISVWPACAGEARDGFAPHYRNMYLYNAPATLNSRGEVVLGYTTPEELIRLLVK
jgi:hypothetical protein